MAKISLKRDVGSSKKKMEGMEALVVEVEGIALASMRGLRSEPRPVD